jgi:hypothetical protein
VTVLSVPFVFVSERILYTATPGPTRRRRRSGPFGETPGHPVLTVGTRLSTRCTISARLDRHPTRPPAAGGNGRWRQVRDRAAKRVAQFLRDLPPLLLKSARPAV